MSKKGYYAVSDSPWLRPILSRKSGAILVHWLFQGILYMDPTERWFKLGLDLLLALFTGGVVSVWLSPLWAVGIGILVAHTLNFICNGQVWVVLKDFGAVQHTQQEFNREVEQLRLRIAKEPYVEYAAAYGSLARSEWSPTSDLDIRLVRAPGLISGWRVCCLAMVERSRAFWKKFPLDLFVFDDYTALNKMAEKNFPVVLVDSTQV